MEQKIVEQNIEKIKQEISSQKLNISRIPRQGLDTFKQIAAEEFADDYGMTLLFLVKYYKGMLPTGLEEIQIQIQELKIRVEEIEKRIPQQTNEEKPRKTLAGTRIGGLN